MENLNICGAFEAVCPSAEFKQRILNMPEEGKSAAKWNHRRILYRGAALAAMLAIILTAALWPRETEEGFVTAPGVLKVYGYDMTSGTQIEEMVSHELQVGVVMPQCFYMPGLNSLYGLPLRFYIEEDALEGMEITFEATVNNGVMYGDIRNDKYKFDPDEAVASLKEACLGQNAIIENGEVIYWNGDDLAYANNGEMDPSYLNVRLDVIIRANEHIVGYTVVDIICADEQTRAVVAQLREAQFFPPVGGKFQEISENDVLDRIEKSKEN